MLAKGGRLLIRAAAIIATSVFAAVLLGWFAFVAYVRTDVTTVPDVSGMTLNEAYEAVFNADLELEWYPVPSTGPSNEAILEQTPPPGEQVRTGRVVNVGVRIPSARARLPDTVGIRLVEAERRLDEAGIGRPDVRFVNDPGAPEGVVVAQQPAQGTQLAVRERPVLTVSRGNQDIRTEPPNVVGMELQEAEATLRQAGFRYIIREPAPANDRNVGRVMNQTPSRAEASTHDPVVLTYGAAGRGFVRVPQVGGLSESDARNRIEQAGLTILDVRTTERSDLPEGVTAVAPSGVTVAGSGVLLTVNRPPVAAGAAPPPPEGANTGSTEASEMTSTERPTIQATAPLRRSASERRVDFRFDPMDVAVDALQSQPYRLELVVEDASGTRSLFDTRVPGGTAVEATVFVEGDDALLKTFVNGVFFQAWRP